MQYDVCVIGAGADGLAAAATLAARGLKTVVVERDTRCGGRCATREFHPGFRASPFVDELPAIPPAIFRALDLARRGAIFAPRFRFAGGMAGPAASGAAMGGGRQLGRTGCGLARRDYRSRASRTPTRRLSADCSRRANPPRRGPARSLRYISLADLCAPEQCDPDAVVHHMARAFGRTDLRSCAGGQRTSSFGRWRGRHAAPAVLGGWRMRCVPRRKMPARKSPAGWKSPTSKESAGASPASVSPTAAKSSHAPSSRPSISSGRFCPFSLGANCRAR